MGLAEDTSGTSTEATNLLAQQVRIFLCDMPRGTKPTTYQALAAALNIPPPNRIHQLTNSLESLIEEDVMAARPLIASFVISKVRGGLPAPGFFDCVRRVGRFEDDPSDPDGSVFHAAEMKRADAYWRKVTETD